MFWGVTFTDFLVPAFFAAQYFLIAAIWRLRPSDDMTRFFAGAGVGAAAGAATSVVIAAGFFAGLPWRFKVPKRLSVSSFERHIPECRGSTQSTHISAVFCPNLRHTIHYARYASR